MGGEGLGSVSSSYAHEMRSGTLEKDIGGAAYRSAWGMYIGFISTG